MRGVRVAAGIVAWTVLLGTLGGAGVRGAWLRAAWGDELTSAEKSWARQATEALASPSERQRASAAAALARLGPEALPTVLTSLAKLKEDVHWDALESACVAMGAKEAAAALEGARASWPKPSAMRLQVLLDRVRAAAEAVPAAPQGPAAPLAPAPAGVAARVKRVLDRIEASRTISSGARTDPRLAEVIAEGRAAIPPLLEEIRLRGAEAIGARAAAHALRELLGAKDVPHVRQLVEDGHVAAALALTKQPAEVAVPVLLLPAAKGMLTYDVFEAMEVFESDPRIHVGLLAWMQAQTADIDGTLHGSVAELLARQRVKAVQPLLEARVFDDAFARSREFVAGALIDLGVRLGVERLIDFFRAPPLDDVPAAASAAGLSDLAWARSRAGKRLNQVVGRPIYKETQSGGFTRSPEGNWEEAARDFLAWFEQHKAKLRFDEKRRAWLTD